MIEMAYKRNLKKGKTKLFRFSEEEFEAMDRILERTGLSFQRYIEFKINKELQEEIVNYNNSQGLMCYE